MSAHRSGHDAWIEVLLDGRALAPRDETELRACAECAAKLRDAEEARRDVESAAKLEHDVLAEARAMRVAPGDERVESTVRALVSGAGRPRKRNRLFFVAAAAAFVAAAWIGARYAIGPPVVKPSPMLGDKIECVAPNGEIKRADYGTFEWRLVLPTGGWYKIDVYADDGISTARIDGIARTEESTWTPANSSSWPKKIRWTVQAMHASALYASGESHAWLSR